MSTTPSPSQLLLGPTMQVQQHLLGLKLSGLQNVQPAIALQRLDVPPADAHSFVNVTTPYQAYPAPGAAANTVLSYTVPQGVNAVINLMAIFHVGGGFINGSGNVIWRVLINDTGQRGMNNLQSQYGTDQLPLPTYIFLAENDTIKVTVEVPALMPPMAPGATTGARFHGYEFAVNKQL